MKWNWASKSPSLRCWWPCYAKSQNGLVSRVRWSRIDEISSNPGSSRCGRDAFLVAQSAKTLLSEKVWKLEYFWNSSTFGSQLKFLIYLSSFALCASECVMSLSNQKLPGSEEISSSRWSQYILKLSRSNSDKSYHLASQHEKVTMILVSEAKSWFRTSVCSTRCCKSFILERCVDGMTGAWIVSELLEFYPKKFV